MLWTEVLFCTGEEAVARMAQRPVWWANFLTTVYGGVKYTEHIKKYKNIKSPNPQIIHSRLNRQFSIKELESSTKYFLNVQYP